MDAVIRGSVQLVAVLQNKHNYIGICASVYRAYDRAYQVGNDRNSSSLCFLRVLTIMISETAGMISQ